MVWLFSIHPIIWKIFEGLFIWPCSFATPLLFSGILTLFIPVLRALNGRLVFLLFFGYTV